MPELTEPQLSLLYWLSHSSTVLEITSDERLTKPIYSGTKEYRDKNGKRHKFDIRTLNKLVDFTLVESQTIYHLGLAWQQYSLTEKGLVYISLLTPSDAFENMFKCVK